MSSSTIGLNNELRKYMLDVSFKDDNILRQLREETLTCLLYTSDAADDP